MLILFSDEGNGGGGTAGRGGGTSPGDVSPGADGLRLILLRGPLTLVLLVVTFMGPLISM